MLNGSKPVLRGGVLNTVMPRISEPFGAAVREVLDARGMSRRGAMTRTGLDHATISKMASGFIPRSETVIRWAQGMGLDPNEWLEKAEYARLEFAASHLGENRETYLMRPAEEGEEESGRRILLEGIRALNEELGRPIAISLDEEELKELTPEKARTTLAFWQEQARKGII